MCNSSEKTYSFFSPSVNRNPKIISTIIQSFLLCFTSIYTAAELPDYVNAPAFSATPKRLADAFKEIPHTNSAKSTSIDILLDKTAPTSGGNGGYWYVFDLNAVSGAITIRNRIQTTAP